MSNGTWVAFASSRITKNTLKLWRSIGPYVWLLAARKASRHARADSVLMVSFGSKVMPLRLMPEATAAAQRAYDHTMVSAPPLIPRDQELDYQSDDQQNADDDP